MKKKTYYQKQQLKQKIKFYLLITLVCILVPGFLSLMEDKVPDIVKQVERGSAKDAFEKATGEKVTNEQIDKLMKTYKEGDKEKLMQKYKEKERRK